MSKSNKNQTTYSMKLTSKKQLEFDLLYKSLIGNTIEITESKNKNQIGKKGTIVNETANFLILSDLTSTSKILKKNITFKMAVKGKALYMDGRLLYSTLTQRIKKLK